ncbi:MAG: hypothetical protein U0894_18575 [Pirellulales bacterium]
MKFSLLEIFILQTGMGIGAGLFYLARSLGVDTNIPALEFYVAVFIGLSVGLIVCFVRRKVGGGN